MIICPYCQACEWQVKAGFNRTGSQRFECQLCCRHYTPDPHPLGYDDATREMALKVYLEVVARRCTSKATASGASGAYLPTCLLSVNHQSVVNWVTAAHAQMAARSEPTPTVTRPETLEMDELFTFVGSKR